MIGITISFAFALASGYFIANLLINPKKTDMIEKITLSLAFSMAFYSIFLFIINVYLGIPIGVITVLLALFMLAALFFKSKPL